MELIDAYEAWLRVTPRADRSEAHEQLLQAVVQQMLKDGSHDTGYIRALVTQAANPRWRGEPLKVRTIRERM
jgi:hypothetical protein